MSAKTLDITLEHCPMTFVKAKLELEKLSKGERLDVLLSKGEPLDNLPKSAEAQGYKVIGIHHEIGNVFRVIIEK
jgi:TusA-related sulfurtransferase